MTISTSQTQAAQCWQEGLDRLLSQNAGADTKFQEAIALDDGLAMAHGGLAFLAMQRARPAEARVSIQHALAHAAGITRRERQQLEAINLWIQGQGRQALAQLSAHLAEFPRDALLMRLAHLLYNRGCSSVGVANFPAAYLALLHGSASYCADNWAFLAEYAWAHHETGALDEAMRRAQRSLALNPTNAVATHSVAHVYFERGDAAGGVDFLGPWLQGFDCPASAYVHLSWHLALFELALGQYHRALERYEHDIRPSVVAKNVATLVDSASLLWRVQLYSGVPAAPSGATPGLPLSDQLWEEACALAMPMADNPGFAFQVAHAALALAASDDHDALTRMLEHLQRTAAEGDLCTREMVVPLVQGIVAFAQGAYAQSARCLESVCPHLVRIGGSHAQREVFEDTLLEAYLRAEQFDQAAAMLAERLARRASPRDTFWLGRVQAGQGQPAQAQASLDTAAQGWRLGDAASPEMTALHRLAAAMQAGEGASRQTGGGAAHG
jgi:tetratricopeptide (TPR) repeat protein